MIFVKHIVGYYLKWHFLTWCCRIKSLERDNSQKRILVEEMKAKIKVVNETTQSDAKTLVTIKQFLLLK